MRASSEHGATAARAPEVPATPDVAPDRGADSASILHLENLGDELRIYWRDGLSSEFLALWLRDNARRIGDQAAAAQDPLEPGYLPDTLIISQAELDESGRVRLHFMPEEITFSFPTWWLRRHGNVDPIEAIDPRETWAADLQTGVPAATYRDVCASREALQQWLHGIRVYGIGLLRGLPPTSGMMLRVMERFSFPRRIETGICFAPDETLLGRIRHHGSSGRGLHTAAPYRDPVPTLRALHCVRPAERGAQSAVVDGLHAVELIARQHPAYLTLLKQYTVPFQRRAGNFHMRMMRPLVTGDHARPVRSIHYDPLNTGALDLPVSAMRDFYSAYCCFSRTLNRVDLRLALALNSGDMLVLDNRRVLYGETASAGKAVMESCYADWDESDGVYPAGGESTQTPEARMVLDVPCHRDGALDADRIP